MSLLMKVIFDVRPKVGKHIDYEILLPTLCFMALSEKVLVIRTGNTYLGRSI
jgi:hypothetical protein